MSDDLTELLDQYTDDEGEVTADGDLKLISALANAQLKLERDIAESELRTQVLKEQHREVAQDKLPEAMAACGVKDFTLQDGSKVEVKDDIATSIKADARPAALQWLTDQGHGSIIKHEVSCAFGRGEGDGAEAALNLLEAAGFSPSDKESVNHQTLQAWGRRMAEEGIRPPEEFFHSFDIHIAKIKAAKK
jgi:hypothetical protein